MIFHANKIKKNDKIYKNVPFVYKQIIIKVFKDINI